MKRLSAGALFKHGMLIYQWIPDSIKALSERTNFVASCLLVWLSFMRFHLTQILLCWLMCAYCLRASLLPEAVEKLGNMNGFCYQRVFCALDGETAPLNLSVSHRPHSHPHRQCQILIQNDRRQHWKETRCKSVK